MNKNITLEDVNQAIEKVYFGNNIEVVNFAKMCFALNIECGDFLENLVECEPHCLPWFNENANFEAYQSQCNYINFMNEYVLITLAKKLVGNDVVITLQEAIDVLDNE